MTRVFWVRHGENWANLTKEFSHRKIDYNLTARGQLQAEQTAAFFEGKQIAAVYSSPLKRALQTAAPIAERLGLGVRVVENFRELNVGTLEDHLPTPEDWTLHDGILGEWIRGDAARSLPGGEDYSTLWKRFSAGLGRVASEQPGRASVIVAHGGNLFCTLHDLCPAEDVARLRAQDITNCAVSELELSFQGERPSAKVLLWAYRGHLSGDADRVVSGSPPRSQRRTPRLIYLSGPRQHASAWLARLQLELGGRAGQNWTFLDSSAEDDLPLEEMTARAGSAEKWRWISAFRWVDRAAREFGGSSGVVIAGQSKPEDVRQAARLFHVAECEVVEISE